MRDFSSQTLTTFTHTHRSDKNRVRQLAHTMSSSNSFIRQDYTKKWQFRVKIMGNVSENLGKSYREVHLETLDWKFLGGKAIVSHCSLPEANVCILIHKSYWTTFRRSFCRILQLNTISSIFLMKVLRKMYLFPRNLSEHFSFEIFSVSFIKDQQKILLKN